MLARRSRVVVGSRGARGGSLLMMCGEYLGMWDCLDLALALAAWILGKGVATVAVLVLGSTTILAVG